MAGKKSSGVHKTSKGERRNVAKQNCTSGYNVTYLDEMLNKQDALSKNKSVWMTIENPNKGQTNRLFIRVKVHGFKKRIAAETET